MIRIIAILSIANVGLIACGTGSTGSTTSAIDRSSSSRVTSANQAARGEFTVNIDGRGTARLQFTLSNITAASAEFSSAVISADPQVRDMVSADQNVRLNSSDGINFKNSDIQLKLTSQSATAQMISYFGVQPAGVEQAGLPSTAPLASPSSTPATQNPRVDSKGHILSDETSRPINDEDRAKEAELLKNPACADYVSGKSNSCSFSDGNGNGYGFSRSTHSHKPAAPRE